MLSMGNVIMLEKIAADCNASPEDRAMAQAIVDAFDEITVEELLEEGMKETKDPTPEQREKFMRRLEEEIKNRYGEPWVAKVL